MPKKPGKKRPPSKPIQYRASHAEHGIIASIMKANRLTTKSAALRWLVLDWAESMKGE